MHTYNYVSCHTCYTLVSKLVLIIIFNIIIDVKNKQLLLHSITVTAKSIKKNERREVNEKFHKLEKGYRDCIKRTRDKTSITHDVPGA